MNSTSSFLIILIFIFSCTKDKTINGLTFKNLDNKPVNIDVKKNSATVFYFLAPECPLSQNYTKEINQLNEKHQSKGVESFAVFSGNIYSADEMDDYKKEYDLQIEGLNDEKYVLSKHFDATITPEVFVLDSDEQVIYSGKIDNWIQSLGVKRQVVTEKYLENALNSLLLGEEVLIKKTDPVGCLIE